MNGPNMSEDRKVCIDQESDTTPIEDYGFRRSGGSRRGIMNFYLDIFRL